MIVWKLLPISLSSLWCCSCCFKPTFEAAASGGGSSDITALAGSAASCVCCLGKLLLSNKLVPFWGADTVIKLGNGGGIWTGCWTGIWAGVGGFWGIWTVVLTVVWTGKGAGWVTLALRIVFTVVSCKGGGWIGVGGGAVVVGSLLIVLTAFFRRLLLFGLRRGFLVSGFLRFVYSYKVQTITNS